MGRSDTESEYGIDAAGDLAGGLCADGRELVVAPSGGQCQQASLESLDGAVVRPAAGEGHLPHKLAGNNGGADVIVADHGPAQGAEARAGKERPIEIEERQTRTPRA